MRKNNAGGSPSSITEAQTESKAFTYTDKCH